MRIQLSSVILTRVGSSRRVRTDHPGWTERPSEPQLDFHSRCRTQMVGSTQHRDLEICETSRTAGRW